MARIYDLIKSTNSEFPRVLFFATIRTNETKTKRDILVGVDGHFFSLDGGGFCDLVGGF